MKRSTLALVDTEAQARSVVEQLTSAGFVQDDISVLFSNKDSTRDFAHEKETKLPEGATIGAGTGGTVGGVVGLLAGLGALAIPGLGPFIAAGPVMAALSGGAIGAGLGGIAGGLVGLGIPEYEAKRYEGKIKEGGILVSVHTDDPDQAREAKRILESAGAHDISTTNESNADVRSGDADDARTGRLGTETVRTVHTTERSGEIGSAEGGHVSPAAPVRTVLGSEGTTTTSTRTSGDVTGPVSPQRVVDEGTADDLKRRL